MSIHRMIFAIVASILLMQAAANAVTPAMLERAKKATALVRISENGALKGYGSAFCIDELGVFVTSARVAGGKVALELVVEPGSKNERVLPAMILRVDKETDLAILYASQVKPLVALRFGKSDALTETKEVVVLGYPFSGELPVNANANSSISVNTGRITSLQRNAGELQLIQVDTALSPGHRGGPVLEASGQVVGIVKSGIADSGGNSAVPVKILSDLLKTPMVNIAPSTLDYARRAKPQQVMVRVFSVGRPTAPYGIRLTLNLENGSGATSVRKLSETSVGGVCTFHIPLVPADSKNLADVPSVSYSVSVSVKNEEIASLEGTFDLAGAPGGPAQKPAPPAAPAPPSQDAPNPAPPVVHIPLPEAGKPYTSIAQMFQTLPDEMQPSDGKWTVGLGVSRELTQRLRSKPALVTGKFASAEMKGNDLEVMLDGGIVDYRGFRMIGKIFCRFPANSRLFKKAQIHDPMTMLGKIDRCVVFSDSTAEARIWLTEPSLKK